MEEPWENYSLLDELINEIFDKLFKKMGILLRNEIHFLQNSVQFAEILSEVWDEEKLDCDTPVLAERKVRFFTKIQIRIFNPKTDILFLY